MSIVLCTRIVRNGHGDCSEAANPTYHHHAALTTTYRFVEHGDDIADAGKALDAVVELHDLHVDLVHTQRIVIHHGEAAVREVVEIRRQGAVPEQEVVEICG